MDFGILGPLYVSVKSNDRTPTAPKPKKVLALLLINGNRMVSTDTLMQELWGDEPPSSALSTLQTYIFQVRRAISRENSDDPHDRLVTTALGYMLKLGPDELDLYLFERMLVDSRGALRRGDLDMASSLLHEALELWRGPALCDVKAGRLLEIGTLQLSERRLMALQLQISTDLRLGRHFELVDQLVALAAEHPHHEAIHSYLMLTLHHSGRRSEALDVYHQLRTALVENLGIEPSNQMQAVYAMVLQGNVDTSRDFRTTEYFSTIRIPEQPSPSGKISLTHQQAASHGNREQPVPWWISAGRPGRRPSSRPPPSLKRPVSSSKRRHNERGHPDEPEPLAVAARRGKERDDKENDDKGRNVTITAPFRMNIRFQVVPGTGEEFEKAWLGLAAAAQAHPANVDQWLARSMEDPDVYYLTTDWRDESGYQDFLKSPGFTEHIVALREYRDSDSMSPSVLVHHCRGQGS